MRWSIEDNEAGKEHRMREQDGDGALDRLAERMGIEAEFRNARGEIVPTAPETKRRLLAAMGVAAGDEAAAEAALAELDRDEWLRPLAPVQVVRTGAGPVAVDLVLPADTGEIAWRLNLEDGGERSGREAFAGLALAAERDLDGRRLQRRRLVLGDDLPWGYHRLSLEPGGAAGTVRGRSSSPPEAAGCRKASRKEGGSGASPRSSICCVPRPIGASAISAICMRWSSLPPPTAPT